LASTSVPAVHWNEEAGNTRPEYAAEIARRGSTPATSTKPLDVRTADVDVSAARCTIGEMSGDDLLFLERDLPSALDATRRDAVKAIATWDPDQLLATAEADIVDYLIAEHSVACPVLRRDQIHQLPVADQVDVVEDWGGRHITQTRTKIVIVVPFDGEDSVFRFRASQFKTSLPRGVVRPGEL
jgi:hypothetical protein